MSEAPARPGAGTARGVAVVLGGGWALALLLVGAAPAIASEGTSEPVEASLERGDTLAFTGRRRAGARAWRAALRAARGAADPDAVAVRLRAQARLHRYAGTSYSRVGNLIAVRRRLADCPPEAPSCQVAFVDVLWLAPRAFEATEAEIDARLAHLARVRPAAAASRARALGRAAGEAPLDGLGMAFARGFQPPGPPGDAAFGLIVAPDLGVGASVALRSATPADGRLVVAGSALVATRGFAGGVVARGALGPAFGWTAQAHGIRTRWFVDEAWTPVAWGGATAGLHTDLVRLAGGHPRVAVGLGLGPALRWDATGERGVAVPGHGGGARAAVGWRATEATGALATVRGDATPRIGGAPYARVGAQARLAAWQRVGPLTLRQGGVGEVARGDDEPLARIPALGGLDSLVSVPAGAVRGPRVGAAWAQVEVDAAWWLAVVGFGELGAAPGVVAPGVGLGLRVRAEEAGPALRIDVARGPYGWQAVVGWREGPSER